MHTTAYIKKDAPEIYKKGRDATREDIQKWANLFHHMSFRTDGFPVIGQHIDKDKRHLVVIDISSSRLREDGRLIDYLTIEAALVTMV